MSYRDHPPGLRQALERAAKLTEAIVVDEQLSLLHDEWARAWLAGRPGEIERFVEEVLASWKAGYADAPTAMRTLADYLDAIEEGLRRHVGTPFTRDATVFDPRDLSREDSTTEEDTLQKDVDRLLLDLTRRGS
ncbi:MAG TPA: hypothetical protein VGG39_03705 [Polyangiaceae bacterium]|jgi:hypothetical protein